MTPEGIRISLIGVSSRAERRIPAIVDGTKVPKSSCVTTVNCGPASYAGTAFLNASTRRIFPTTSLISS
jgi:hypothetical protein